MRQVFVLLLVACLTAAQAQVSNNNIEDRLRLELNQKIQSSTAGSSVQWKCINKALTNKCLVYHNDQWFSFSVESNGDYFINISSQQCRDEKGVQLILIEGNPCEISTYRIIECIDQIRREDVFVEMNNLKAGVQYLVNVDGFLGDHCQFDIEVSDRPKGIPRAPVNLDTLEIASRLENKIVSMEWTIGEDLRKELSSFRVFQRKNASRLELAADISIDRNAYGRGAGTYEFVDTLSQTGNYTYEIYGIRSIDDRPMLLSQRQFAIAPALVAPREKAVMKVLPVRMNFKENDPFQLRLYNYDGDELLWKHNGESQGEGELFMIDPQPYVQYGLRKFQLLVLDGHGNKVDEIYFRVEGSGQVIKE